MQSIQPSLCTRVTPRELRDSEKNQRNHQPKELIERGSGDCCIGISMRPCVDASFLPADRRSEKEEREGKYARRANRSRVTWNRAYTYACTIYRRGNSRIPCTSSEPRICKLEPGDFDEVQSKFNTEVNVPCNFPRFEENLERLSK